MSTAFDYSLDWPRSRYENILLIPMYVAAGLSLLSFTTTTCIRLLWWNSKWHFIETLTKIDQKIISYVLDGFLKVLDGREEIEQTMDTDKSLKEIQLQAFTDEVDVGKAEEIIQNTRSNVKIHRMNILRSKYSINILILYFHVIVLLIFISFWSTFILETTFGCDHHRDCYVGNTGQDPIPDCDLINPKNTSVVCYQLEFDSVNGIINIGGTTFVAVGGFGLMTHLVLLVQDSCRRHWVRIILNIIMLAVQYTVFFANLAFFIYIQILERRGHQAYRIISIVHAITTFIAVFICITSPWVLVLWAWCETRNQKNRLLMHIQTPKKCEEKDEHADTEQTV